MALRSRIQTIKAPVAEDEHPAPTEVQSGNLPVRGSVRAPATPLDNLRAEADIPEEVTHGATPTANDPTPAERKENKRLAREGVKIAKKTRIVNPVADNATAPQLRGSLKDLEAKIKVARAKHDGELKSLRDEHRNIHDRLFDLTK